VSGGVLDVASGAIRPLTGEPRFQSNAQWSPDGASVVYDSPREGRGDLGWVNEIHIVPAAGGAARSLTRGLDRQVYSAEWMPGGKSILVAADDRTTVGLWVQPLQGPAKRLELGDLVVNGAFGYDVAVAKSGAIVFAATTADHPSE